MLKNYFFLSPIIKDLNKKVNQTQIIQIYTQTKNEIVFETDGGFLLVGMHQKIPYLIYQETYHRKSQSLSLFPELVSDRIIELAFISNKRLIKLSLTTHTIYLNLFYRDVGLSIYRERELIRSVKAPVGIQEPEVITEDHFYPLLNHELAFRNIGRTEFLTELNSSRDFYFYRNDSGSQFSNIPLTHLKTEPFLYLKNGLTTGYYQNVFRLIAEESYNALFKQLEQCVEKQSHYVSKTIENLEAVADDPSKYEKFEQFGHLIMSNIHQLKSGQTILQTTNWYSDAQEIIDIQLKPNLSAHENAENYYRKAKASAQNATQLTVRKAHFYEKYKLVETLRTKLFQAKRLKDLEKIKKICILEGWIGAESNKEKRLMQHKSFNYYEFSIDGHDVIVGKDSKSNDYLSLKYAKANDYWFHVQGSPGSHVVLKWHGYKEDPQKDLLKKVAALTAYYSKMKNAGSIPVIYTQAKYVKKPKGAKPGAVTVSKEKSIFVQPKPIEELK